MNTLPYDPHLAFIRPVLPRTKGCEDCLRTGSAWVHLRLCLTCGKVGCCDTSPNKHARKHAQQSGHPIVRSLEPGENWRWCFAHEAFV
ncbi:UBP-type zinc finger domain-containing protein [Jiangella muralis]|uniref:UBP-type zinc finger domain-containing protein n=1 Tax=Jiangella muralis TaxID=702383 RepID=UPI00069E4F89|nr:UBP-type zinc finger domain-containing protein [Jiangella muralis]